MRQATAPGTQRSARGRSHRRASERRQTPQSSRGRPPNRFQSFPQTSCRQSRLQIRRRGIQSVDTSDGRPLPPSPRGKHHATERSLRAALPNSPSLSLHRPGQSECSGPWRHRRVFLARAAPEATSRCSERSQLLTILTSQCEGGQATGDERHVHLLRAFGFCSRASA